MSPLQECRFSQGFDPLPTSPIFIRASPLVQNGEGRFCRENATSKLLYQMQWSDRLMARHTLTGAIPTSSRDSRNSGQGCREVITMDSVIIGLYREEARVFRTAMEKSIKHEMKMQEAKIAKTGKKAGLQVLSKEACEDVASVLDDMAACLAKHGNPDKDASAKAIDRMVSDFANTSADLRGLAKGTVRARTPSEKKEQEEAHATALADLEKAQKALDALNRNATRLS